MRLPNAGQACVEREKIVNYLLSMEHPRGRNKAVFFSGLGFHVDGWQDFAEALIAHASRHEVTQVVELPTARAIG